MTSLRVYLFGAPRVALDGEMLTISRRKVMALLAYMAVTGRLHTRDSLAALLWPEYDDSSARANLRRDLSRLKGEIGEDFLLIDRNQAGIDPQASVWVDTVAFEQSLDGVREHGHESGPICSECAETLATAVTVYEGDFMAGFALPDSPDFDEWQFFQAQGLRHGLAEALQQLIDWHVARAEYEQGIEYGRRWLALDPLHEPAHRKLMQLYAWSGQHAAALRQYQECVRILEEELGVEPQEETVALHEAIRARKVSSPEATTGPAAAELAVQARFEAIELLAVGGHAEVYRGRDRLSGADIVIKRLKPELSVRDPRFVQRFAQEGRALSQLNHPNIVHLLDTFEQDGQQNIVMEYVPGGSLRQRLDSEGALPLDVALDIALELADALARAHHLNIMHRDLKPDNVLLAEDGTPRLSDFGLARLRRDDVRLTQTGAVMGSPAYMSPEALRGEEFDRRSDMWSFGVLLYEMIAGRKPFEGEKLTPVLVSILQEPVPDITQIRPDLPQRLADLVHHLLQKERGKRPASMRQVAAVLEAIRSGGSPIESEQAWQVQTGPVERAEAPPETGATGQLPSPASRRAAEQEIGFCASSDGTRIAFATVGQGPALVKAANWLSHLEYDWNSPVWRHWWTALSEGHTLVRYDERGCGLSDRDVDELSMEAFVRDLESVVDTLGLKRFPLLGVSQGGPVAISYAVRHPRKVSHLILYGTYGAGRYNRTYSPEEAEKSRVIMQLIRAGWGQDNPAFRQFFTTLFMPEATQEQMNWFNELQRVSASPEMAARLEESFFNIDVRDLLSQVQVPTLILHGRDDAIVPYREGRELAAKISHARFVTLDSKNHILLADEPAWQRFLAEVRWFIDEDREPPLDLREHAQLREAEEARRQAAATRHPAHNLPAEATPFVGREQEVADLKRLLLQERERRLLTLTGPGGIGKTRLALAAATQVAQAFRNGVFFVPLAPLTSAEQILPELAENVDYTFYQGSDPRKQLLDYLRNKQMLLVMDNFEHLLEGAPLLSDIIERAPQVTILVTSRERLNLSEETVYTLGGLAYPPQSQMGGLRSEADLAGYGAVKLLLQRARMVRPNLTLRPQDLRDAARVGNLVQGMPLGLILAAGWLEMLTFGEIAEEIAQSTDLLESDSRHMPERHRSIRAAFNYSWERLQENERRTFTRLAVFPGGFTRGAAETVAGAGLRTLRTLVSRSFVSTKSQGRYEVHELLRHFGLEQLAKAGEAAEARRAHGEYYLQGLQQREVDLRGLRQLEALEEIESELENMRAAWEWALEQGELDAVDRTLDSLFIFSYMKSRYREGIDLLEKARVHLAPYSGEQPDRLWARVVARLGFLRSHFSRLLESEADLKESLAIAEKYDAQAEVAFSLLALGCFTSYVHRDPATALPFAERSLDIYRSLNDDFFTVLSLIWVGYCHGNSTGLANFNRYMREALELAQSTGNQVYAANAISNLAAGAFCEGDYAAAEYYARESMEYAFNLDLRLAMAHAKVQLSLAHFLHGEAAPAEKLARKALEEAGEINYATTMAYANSMLSLLASTGEDYELGRLLARKGIGMPSTVFGAILGHWASAVAHASLQESGEADIHAREVLQQAGSAGYTAMLTWPLPVAAATLWQGGENERAVELLALAEHHVLSPEEWIEQWPFIVRVRAELRAVLAPEAYQAAVERGQELDLQETVEWLLSRPAEPGLSPAQRAAHNLPTPATPFVGRGEALKEIQQRLLGRRSPRLVTLIGPGGIGKTRLALAVAGAVAGSFRDGVFFVPLAPLASAEDIVPAVAESIGLQPGDAGDLRQQLLAYVRDRELLLVMDNFEHLLPGAGLLAEILEGAPQAKILATSRERLNLSGESVYTVPGLSYPEWEPGEKVPPGTIFPEYGAILLLLQRARLVRSNYSLQAEDLPAMMQICRLVQGMPLGLILAASWLEVLSFEEIADEIAASLDFLESEARDLPERQRSLRAAFDHSWKRLAPEEQTAFMKLTVFRGGFTRQAAEAVAGAGMDTLRKLANKSFLTANRLGRYEIHDTMRQFGREILETRGLAQETGDAHSCYYLDAVAGQTEKLKGSGQPEAVDQIDADFANVRAAWRWASEQKQGAAIDGTLEAMTLFFNAYKRPPEEYVELLQQARRKLAEDGPNGGGRAERLLNRIDIFLALEQSFLSRAQEDTRDILLKGLAVAREQGHVLDAAYALRGLATYQLRVAGDRASALSYFQESHEQFMAAGELSLAARALEWASACQQDLGRLDQAIETGQEALQIYRDSGDRINAAMVLANLGETALCLGDYAGAEQYEREALAEAQAIGPWFPLPVAEARLALLHFLRGDVAQAAEKAQAANQLALETPAQLAAIGRPYALAVMSLKESLAGESTTALRLAEEAASFAAGTTTLGQILSKWALSVALYGLRQEEAAWTSILEALRQAHAAGYKALLTWLLPVAAAILACRGEPVQAVELLALSYTHPARATGWLAKWSALDGLQQALAGELGQEQYQAAWQQGKTEEPAEAVERLLAA